MSGQVLVVEESKVLREMLKTLLEAEGYDATVVADPRAALATLDHLRPDLIVLDPGLPGGGGMALAQDLERLGRRPAIPLLLIGAQSNLARLAGQLGAEGYIRKPFHAGTFVRAVRNLARRPARVWQPPPDRTGGADYAFAPSVAAQAQPPPP
jgi:two-component system OmpR family response regulator